MMTEIGTILFFLGLLFYFTHPPNMPLSGRMVWGGMGLSDVVG